MRGWVLLAAALAAAVAAMATLRSGGKLVRREDAAEPGPITLPLPEPQAVAAVLRLLREKDAPPNPAFRAFAVAGTQDPIFPGDDLIRATAAHDPALQRYLSLPGPARARDLYFFEPVGDRYWFSEYARDGKPVRFRCAFFVHFEPASPAQTRVEVFEYVPTVALGRKPGLGAHGPGFFEDIRQVAPTVSDRAQLLRWIATAK